MALITCPECGKQISDKAPACIHCGYPMQEQPPVTTATVSNSKKVLAPGENRHSGPGENRQFWPDENRQSLFTI